jgi:sugar transferase EpsL
VALHFFPPEIPFFKRLFDLIVVSIVLIILSPLYLIIAILIVFTDGLPVIFKQKRPGFKGKLFGLYKFRSMRNTLDAKGDLLPEEQRLFPLGRFLRHTSLDELPEFINILRGEMSLVGPRPLLVEYLPYYTSEQARRHDVMPGITGWAQINGRNAIQWEDRFKLDVWYVDHWSLWLDMRILFITLWKVIRGEGISPENGEIMERFTDHKGSVKIQK